MIAVCYNHSEYLEATLDSILAQTYINIEIIIIDDCSQDRSVSVIQNWIISNKVAPKFIAHNKNIGLCPTLNEALKYCNGQYIQFISCDDVLYLGKIEKQVDLFTNSAYEDLAFVYSDMTLINKTGEVTSDSFYNHLAIDISALPRGNAYETLIQSNVVPAPSLLIDREKLIGLGGFDVSLSFEDLDYILRSTRLYNIDFLPFPTVYYRVLENSLSRKITPSYIESHLILFKKHINHPSRKIRKTVRQKLALYSILAYKYRVPKSAKWLGYLVAQEPNLRNLLLLISAHFNIDYDKALGLANIPKRLKRKAINIIKI